jgi:hypothetical protein
MFSHRFRIRFHPCRTLFGGYLWGTLPILAFVLFSIMPIICRISPFVKDFVRF